MTNYLVHGADARQTIVDVMHPAEMGLEMVALDEASTAEGALVSLVT